MKLELSPISSRHLLGYILGTQELELREIIQRIVSTNYRTVLNVGAADGFYAVGLAMKMPGVDVVAFETDERLHGVIARSAQINGVRSRIQIVGRCRVEHLRRKLAETAGPTLVFMDIEGGEIDLLDPEMLPELEAADILVETHDAFVADCTQTLACRFSATHEIECIQARPREASDFPQGFLAPIRSLFPALCVDLMDERRVGVQQWLYLVAKRA
jgi:precorrin-6B methylase 2